MSFLSKGDLLGWLFFLFFALSASLMGQNIQLSGYITDQEKHPLEGVNIFIEGIQKGTYSNQRGYYELSIPLSDSTVVQFSFVGYETRQETLSIKNNRSVTLNIEMISSQTQLGDITVTEIRRQLTPMQRLDASRIKLLPDATGGSIEALLSTVAGVSSVNELSSQYSVRGGSYDENMVYINGFEIYRPQLVRAGQQEGMSIINPDMVENVAFSTGGFDAKYGDKMSSVLDITYKKPTAVEASLSLGLMGASLYFGHATKDKKFTQIHGFRYRNNSGILGTMDTKGEYRPWDIDYQLYLSWQPTKKFSLDILGNIAQNTYLFTPQTRETSFGSANLSRTFKVYFDGQENDRFRTMMGALKLTYKPKANLSLSLQTSVFNTDEEETYDIRGEYWLSELDQQGQTDAPQEGGTLGVGSYMEHARNRLNATVYNVSHNGRYTIKENTFEWGLGFQMEQIHDKMREWEMRDSAGYALPYHPSSLQLLYVLDSDYSLQSYRVTGYIQDTQKFRTEVGLFTLNIGVRFNYWNFNKELTVSPRAALSFLPAKNHNFAFRLSGGIYHQAPFYREYRDTLTGKNGVSIVTLNPKIKSPRSVQAIFGMDYYFKMFSRNFKFTSEVYYKYMDNLIPFQVDGVRIRYLGQNMSTGWGAGLDMKLFGEFVPGVDSWISLSLMKNQETVNGKTVPRPNDQLYNFSIFFQDYFPGYEKLRLNLKFVWADGLPFGAPGSPIGETSFRMPPYRRVDIGLSWGMVRGRDKFMNRPFFRHLKGFNIGVDCFNLFGFNNVNSYYWVTDIYNQQYAVPNYLTGRMFNVRLQVDL